MSSTSSDHPVHQLPGGGTCQIITDPKILAMFVSLADRIRAIAPGRTCQFQNRGRESIRAACRSVERSRAKEGVICKFRIRKSFLDETCYVVYRLTDEQALLEKQSKPPA